MPLRAINQAVTWKSYVAYPDLICVDLVQWYTVKASRSLNTGQNLRMLLRHLRHD